MRQQKTSMRTVDRSTSGDGLREGGVKNIAKAANELETLGLDVDINWEFISTKTNGLQKKEQYFKNFR